MKIRKMATGLALAAFAMLEVGASGAEGQQANVKPAPPAGFAAQYCRSTTGVPLTGIPYYGTNGGTPLQLAGHSGFCQYTAQDGSQATVLLSSLVATLPSLAATAYYAQIPAGSCNGNPLSCYCTLLGGSDQFGGTTGAGGGWVFNGNLNSVLEACIFPDESSIDSGALFYHSAGIIRGIDLSTVLRYKNP